MNEKIPVDLSFIKIEYYRKKLKDYLEHIFSQNKDFVGILLFGSVAKNNARDDEFYSSDIDIIIICENLPSGIWERKEFVFELTKEVCSGIQDFWWTLKELKRLLNSKFYLLLDAFDEGKILYDPECILKDLRDKLFKELEAKGVIKTDLYWQWPIKHFGDKIEF
jgi:predicted nucleotidyltransferase